MPSPASLFSSSKGCCGRSQSGFDCTLFFSFLFFSFHRSLARAARPSESGGTTRQRHPASSSSSPHPPLWTPLPPSLVSCSTPLSHFLFLAADGPAAVRTTPAAEASFPSPHTKREANISDTRTAPHFSFCSHFNLLQVCALPQRRLFFLPLVCAWLHLVPLPPLCAFVVAVRRSAFAQRRTAATSP